MAPVSPTGPLGPMEPGLPAAPVAPEHTVNVTVEAQLPQRQRAMRNRETAVQGHPMSSVVVLIDAASLLISTQYIFIYLYLLLNRT